MNGGLKTSLDLDKGPVFVHVIHHAPDQGIIAEIKDKHVRLPETPAKPGKQYPGEIARRGAQRYPYVHENGIAPYYGEDVYKRQVIGYDLPGFGDELCGLPYLPRLIAKARAKLVGSISRRFSSELKLS